MGDWRSQSDWINLPNPSRNDHIRPDLGGGSPRAIASRRRRFAERRKPRITLPCFASISAAREGGFETQQFQVAAVNAGDEGVAEHFRRLTAHAATEKLADRFVIIRSAARASEFAQKPNFATNAQQSSGQQAKRAAWQFLQALVEKQEAMFARLIARGNEFVANSEVAAKLNGGGFGFEKAIGPRLDDEAVFMFGANLAARL